MGKILVIAEKPSAGKDIARILGVTNTNDGYMENEQYIVTWAIGHLIGLKDPEEIDPKYQRWNVDDLPLPYDNGLKVLTNTRSQYRVVKGLIQREDIDYLIPHQANIRIIQAVQERLGYSDDKVVTNIKYYGNTSAASIPLALAESVEKGNVKLGSTAILCGFGAGMTWGGAIVRLREGIC